MELQQKEKKNYVCTHYLTTFKTWNNDLMPIAGSEKGHQIGYLNDYDNYQKMVNVGFKKGEDNFEKTLGKHGFVLVFYRLNSKPSMN